ncbi:MULTISPECIES: glycosyltransferase [unclassified Neochlamydia]|uniref:glycosyltransferase n=1 Tax=unclassified Neochlamydia TaxID=2643326 RepID=UPI00140B7D93|nr:MULTISPECIES: glycosyltransferase [unclassified Neochlamydia]
MVRILLNCLDTLGKSMAGPAIRYWEFAHALAKSHQVTLRVPNQTDQVSTNFTISTGPIQFKKIDVIITQTIDPNLALHAKRHKIPLIYDAYDPEPLEHLEIFKPSALKVRKHLNRAIIHTINFNLRMADAVICANHRQRDLWIGALLSLRKISPSIYDQDETLHKLVGIAPFGIPSRPAIQSNSGFREKFNIKASDKLLLWGGGIWNWFDPLTLIRAVKELSKQRSDIKLVFMGIRHPNASIPIMSMANKAIKLAEDLKIKDQFVFFNEQWIPYEERENFLLDADIGVSTHFEHLETQYSFRTRLLDYIWAGLPLITTEGDVFAELVLKNKIGKVVPAQDIQALVLAISQLIDNSAETLRIKSKLKELREQLVWEKAVVPLEEIIEHLMNNPLKNYFAYDLAKIFYYQLQKCHPWNLIERWWVRRNNGIKT